MRKVLFFHARWCGPCRYAKREFMDQLAADYPNHVELIDVDRKPAEAKRYGVHRLPTYILTGGPGVPRKLEGGVDVGELRNWLQES